MLVLSASGLSCLRQLSVDKVHIYCSTSSSFIYDLSPVAVPPKCGTSTQCSALAALRIRVNGIGRCRGTARADCFAFASASEPCFAEVSRKISLGECRPVDIEIFASCTASAVATVFANAFVSISCEGQGSGCGFAQANGEAWACSFASAVAQLLVNVNDGEAVCDVDVGAMAAVFASVATEAQAAVCTDGSSTGFVFDFEREFGSRAESIIADAAASCFVTCFPGMQQTLPFAIITF